MIPRAANELHGSLAVVLLTALISSCDSEPRPWDGPVGNTLIDESEPFLPVPAEAGVPDGAADRADQESNSISRVGGLWVSCYGGFEPADDPQLSLTKLTLMCGPANGMKPLSEDPFVGEVSEGGEPRAWSVPIIAGSCFRVFAVADRGIADLDVSIKSSRGTRVGADDGEDRWPIVYPDRPLCTFEDDTFTIEVSAAKGAGRFAAAVWTLPAKL